MNTFLPERLRRIRVAFAVCGVLAVWSIIGLLGGSSFAQGNSSDNKETQGPNPASCGFTWTEENAVGIQNSYYLNGVAAISADDVWVVGEETIPSSTRVVLEHWDGISWTHIPQGDVNGDVISLDAVSAVATDNVWAFGTNEAGLTVPVHWDGVGWTVFPGPGSPLYSINDGLAFANNDLWIVGQRFIMDHYQSYAAHRTNNSWSLVPIPGGSLPESTIQSISAVGPDDIWVVGYSYTFANPTRVAFTSHWDGNSWTEVALPALGTSSMLLDVSALAADNAYAVGTYEDQSGSTLSAVLHWDGSAWALEDALGNTPQTLVDRGGGEMWAMGKGPYLQVQYLDSYFGWSATGGPDIFPSLYLSGYMKSASADGEIWVVGTEYSQEVNLGWIRHYGEKVISYADVSQDDGFFPYIKCLSCAGVINGYACGGPGEPCNTTNDPYFRPGNPVTRGQLAKIVVEASNTSGRVNNPPGNIFEDVPAGSTFYQYVIALAAQGAISGYPCGGPGEPCIAPDNKPYFRPNATASRGQLAKIVSEAAGFADPIGPGTQTFEDVPEGSTFHLYVERLAMRSVISGYPCGGPGEPCVAPGNRPYFRPGALVTRGQTAKIASNTFMPSCQAR